MSKHVYVAGPLFTPSQRRRLEEIDDLCRKCGHSTYLPHRDGGVFDRGEADPTVFFDADKEAIDDSDLLLAMLNGPPFDSGTVWEVGYAYARGVPIIGIIEDERVFDIENQMNPMLVGSINVIVRSLAELRAEIAEGQT